MIKFFIFAENDTIGKHDNYEEQSITSIVAKHDGQGR